MNTETDTQAEDTTEETQNGAVINIDGVPYLVNSLPDQIKRMVSIYDTWAKEENTINLELMKLQSAKTTLSNQIIDAVNKEKEEPVPDSEVSEDCAPAPDPSD